MSNATLLWTGFGVVVVCMMILDLFVFNRKAHEVRFREALAWSSMWVGLALVFNIGVWIVRGHKSGLEFLTGYLIELSLSVDNLFVFLLVFSYFRVPAAYQHKVLFWGILGAVVMRAVFIAAGVTLIHRFEWMIYLFGILLIISGIKMLSHKDRELHPEKNPVLRLFRRFVPVAPDYVGGSFFVRREQRLYATPLFVVLLIVESTDLVFAIDSIPAILAVTTDAMIVYTSNVFAILGLRSMYFVLSGFMQLFHYLHYGLSLILVFVGIKMLISHYVHIPVALALGTVASLLGLSVVASVIWPKPGKPIQA